MLNAPVALPTFGLAHAGLIKLARALLHRVRHFIGVPANHSITTDQMNTVMTATTMAMSGHIFNTAIASIALAYNQANTNWIIWSIFSFSIAAYVLQRRKFQGTVNRKVVSRRALNRTITFGVLLALPWGALPVFYLNPSDELTMLIIIALVTGMSASGGILLAPVFPAAFCYVATIILPTFAVLVSFGPKIEFFLLSCLAISYAGFLFATISIVARLSIANSKAKKSLESTISKIRKTTDQMDKVLELDSSKTKTDFILPKTKNILETLERSTQKLIDQGERLRTSEGRLSDLLDTAVDAIISIDPHGRIERLNPAARSQFEIDEAHMALPQIKDLLNSDGWQEVSQKLLAADNSSAGSKISMLMETEGLRRSGKAFPIELSLAAAGSDGHTTLVIRDITQRKSSEAKLDLLMNEVNHRSRNLMAVLSSICAMTASRAQSIEEFSSKFSKRMNSLMRSQELITADGWGESPFSALIDLQLKIYAAENPDRIALRGPMVFLKPKAVQNLGLAFHELATNSAKYGALSASHGVVKISWRVVSKQDKKSLVIVWRELNGPPVQAPERNGFGSFLLQKVVAQDLNGRAVTKHRKNGLVWQAHIDHCFFSESK